MGITLAARINSAYEFPPFRLGGGNMQFAKRYAFHFLMREDV